jgi:hypothetical protein
MVQCGVADKGLLEGVEELSHGYRVTRNPTKVECREVCQTFPRQAVRAPEMRNSRKDERSPLKTAVRMVGGLVGVGRVLGWPGRGARQWRKFLVSSARSFEDPEMDRLLSRQGAGQSRGASFIKGGCPPPLMRVSKGDVFERSR